MTVADPIKPYFLANKEFLRFLLLSYVILLSVIFFLHGTKHSNETMKIGKRREISYIGSAPDPERLRAIKIMFLEMKRGMQTNVHQNYYELVFVVKPYYV